MIITLATTQLDSPEMNEEQAVLDFFAQEENLSLGLAVAEQMDTIRQRMNSAFWRMLAQRLENLAPAWQVRLTEDRNTEDNLVGLHFEPVMEQALFLRPMLEQQTVGETPRIYFGLIWSSQPAPDRLALPEVAALREALQHEGFKDNEKFLAWQWSPHHPRSKQFLLRFSTHPENLLNEASGLARQLLITHGAMLAAANTVLLEAPHSTVISLDTLRGSLKRQ